MRGVLIWMMIVLAESINGTMREWFLTPAMGDLRARHISFLTAAVLIIVISSIFVSWTGASTLKQLLAVGVSWSVLTVGFEAFLVRPGLHISWERFWADYDIARGGLMAIGLIVLALAPFFASLMDKSVRKLVTRMMSER
jgi:hypothetical protein